MDKFWNSLAGYSWNKFCLFAEQDDPKAKPKKGASYGSDEEFKLSGDEDAGSESEEPSDDGSDFVPSEEEKPKRKAPARGRGGGGRAPARRGRGKRGKAVIQYVNIWCYIRL